MKLSEKVLHLRKQNNMSQEQLAEQLSVSRQAISKWEAEQSVPELNKIVQLSKVFGVSTDYLLKEEVEIPNGIGSYDFIGNLRITTGFKISTALILIGLIISVFGWMEKQTLVSVGIGLVIQILGCVFFEEFSSIKDENRISSSVRKKFYAINIWMLLPIPIYIFFFGVVFRLFGFIRNYNVILPFVVSSVTYLILTVVTTTVLLRQFNHRK